MLQFNASLQRECLAFIEKRLKHDAALAEQLAVCKGPDEIARTYSEFMRTAFEDYRQEFTTFAQIGGSMVSETVRTMQFGEAGGGQAEHVAARTSPPQPGARQGPVSAAGMEH